MESLAKGAVQFSRRFTIRELRERWRALLYDLDTSTEASARMVETETELAASNLPKSNRVCIPKGKDSSPGKRKVDSMRSHYYAMRKRIRSEPCATNLSFLGPPSIFASTECDSGPGHHLKPQNKHPAGNFTLETPFSDDYGHPQAGYASGQHAFPELMRVDSAAANHLYQAGHAGLVEDDIPDGRSNDGCLIRYPENVSSVPRDEAECNNGNQSFEHNFQQRDFPNILGENLINTSSEVHEISQTNALGTSNSYEHVDTGAGPLPGFDSSDNMHEDFHSDFVRNSNLSSDVPAYGSSFLQPPRYCSPPSVMPVWGSMGNMSTPSMPMDGHYGDKAQGLLELDGREDINHPGCDVASSESKLKNEICSAELNNATILPVNDFIDFSDSYMDFADDEDLLFIEVNEKDNTDRSGLGLSSILLSSPGETHHGVTTSGDLGATNALESCLGFRDATCAGESNVISDLNTSDLRNDRSRPFSGVNMLSTSSQTSNTVELREEFMICVVNKEDLEIPNNDHVTFSDPVFSCNMDQCISEITGLVSSDSVLSNDEKEPVKDLNKGKEDAANVQRATSSLKTNSSSLSKANSCDGCAVEVEPSKGGFVAVGSRFFCSGVDEPNLGNTETVGLNSTPVGALEEESTANLDNPDATFASFLESHLREADDAKVDSLNVSDTYPEEANMQVGIPTCSPLDPDLISGEVRASDAVVIMSTSFQEEQFSDSEDDVPYFSDIEAMVRFPPGACLSFLVCVCVCVL